MIFKRVIKSNEEQAIASWTNYINQVRLDNLLKNLQNQNQNFKDAINTLDSTMHQINKSIYRTESWWDKRNAWFYC